MEREEQKFNELGPQLGGMAAAIVEADAIAKQRTLQRQVEILGMDNIKASAITTLVGQEDALQVDYDIPVAVVADMRGLEVQTSTIKTTMNVSASRDNSLSIDSQTEASGSAKIGFGLFSASASFKSTVGVHKDVRRKSDYSSTLEVDINMAQSPVPEGLMKVMDSINKVVEAATEINVGLTLDGLDETAPQE
ncbi:MAG: DUF2589 domain-containing protein [Parvibaculales bacterium]